MSTLFLHFFEVFSNFFFPGRKRAGKWGERNTVGAWDSGMESDGAKGMEMDGACAGWKDGERRNDGDGI